MCDLRLIHAGARVYCFHFEWIVSFKRNWEEKENETFFDIRLFYVWNFFVIIFIWKFPIYKQWLKIETKQQPKKTRQIKTKFQKSTYYFTEPAPSERGRTISRISVAKGSNLNFRGRKSNSLMNLCGKTAPQANAKSFIIQKKNISLFLKHTTIKQERNNSSTPSL